MAGTVDSTAAPAQHGPVTLALRALAAEYGQPTGNVISFAARRPRRIPFFTPLDFVFPLDDATWSKVHLHAVRFATDFVNFTGREAVETVLVARSQSTSVTESTQRLLSRTINELETLAELLRTAQSRLREASAVAAQIEREDRA